MHLLDTAAPILADGIRNSTDCPARQYREYIVPGAYPPFPIGYGLRGHAMADAFIERVYQGRKLHAWKGDAWTLRDWEFPAGAVVEVECAIPWEHGTTHIDVVDHAEQLCDEIKSVGKCSMCPHGAKDSTSPQAYQRRQVERQMRHAQVAEHCTADYAWRIQIVCANCYYHHGPFTITLSNDRRIQIDADVARLTEWMHAGIDVDDATVAAACTCGMCTPPKPRASAPIKLDDLHGDYEAVRLQIAEAQATVKTLKPVQDELKERMRALIPTADAVYETVTGTVQIDKRGALRAVAARV